MSPRAGVGRSTIAVHGLPRRPPDWSPVAPPIHQSSTFTNPVGSDEEVRYTRYGNNPNQLDIARKYALLEGAEDAVFLARLGSFLHRALVFTGSLHRELGNRN